MLLGDVGAEKRAQAAVGNIPITDLEKTGLLTGLSFSVLSLHLNSAYELVGAAITEFQ